MTLCKDFDCPLRTDCARYLKPIDQSDSFFESSPRGQATRSCMEFMPWLKHNRELTAVPRKEKNDAYKRTNEVIRNTF